MRYLIDTCVISALATSRPDAGVVEWIDSVDPDAVHLSVITIGEIQKGIEKLPASRRRATLQSWLENELLVRFADRIAPLDTEILLEWGRLAARLERAGRMVPAVDSFIAATALHGGFVLVTRNEGDFAPTGVQLLNPWR